ncbi:MAG: glutathione-disulfide reductase [Spirulinaceae cyanobacterium]
MSYDYDLFVIGAGSGGVACARRAAGYGAKVGIAEFSRLGGTCVNRGCIPKKLMVYASHFPELFHDAKGYGWSGVESSLDWQKLVTAIDQELTRLNGVYQRMLDKASVKIYRGYAKFLDPHTLEIGEEKVTAEKILIAVGGKPQKPDIPGIEHTITSDDMFTLKEQPKQIIILGGGYIGTEFACIMNGLGTQVTQIVRSEQILRGFDDDLRSTIAEAMVSHGINLITGTEAKKVTKTDKGLKVENATAKVVLAATGRIPNLEKLGLENTGVEVKNGAVVADKYGQTAQKNVYAVGDCLDRVQLTPVAIREGRAFADTEFGGMSKTMAYDNIPTAIFSTPEAGAVGLTEAEAQEEYGEEAIKTYRAKFKSTYYSLAHRDEKTMMKLIVNQENDQVLGAHMVGDHAAEIIQGIAIAVKKGCTKADFDATVALHPTVAEEFVTMQ